MTLPKTMRIYYSSLSAPHFIECPCSRWDISDYMLTIETILTKSQRDTLYAHITPGAVGELYRILGKSIYYDKTWTGDNTLKIVPISGTNLDDMFSEKIIYVKNYSDSIIGTDYFDVKIEGYISGGTL